MREAVIWRFPFIVRRGAGWVILGSEGGDAPSFWTQEIGPYRLSIKLLIVYQY
jgi:hypothetical protein